MSSQLSSTLSVSAKNCIDDDIDTYCHTDEGINQWLSVELLATEPPQIVTGVEVYNRQNGYWNRLGSFEVWVGSSSGQWGARSGATLCVAATAPATAGPFVHACDTASGPHVGKFVTILRSGA